MGFIQTPKQPLALSPTTQDGGENEMKKMGPDKDKKITHQLPAWAKHN